jgi:flagellar basal-body rod modification protein FlgD
MITAVRRTSIADSLAPAATPAQPGDAGTSAPRTLPTNSKGMGQDEFLKMLVAQLKNQDPLNPMDGKDMAAQLAQFSTVEQLIAMNTSIDAQKGSQQAMTDAIQSLETAQNERASELAALIEGQMAMATVGKTGVTAGNTAFVDRAGQGTVVIDAGTMSGKGRLTMVNAKGETVGTAMIGAVKPGQQSFALGDLTWTPKPEPGTYSYKFEIDAGNGQYLSAKTFTAGRITGMKYENGNPIMIIGDAITVPMSQLTQIRS